MVAKEKRTLAPTYLFKVAAVTLSELQCFSQDWNLNPTDVRSFSTILLVTPAIICRVL